MFERPDPTFEPSSQTKEAMLYVRKRQLSLAGIRHPGYFGIHNYTGDWILFSVALTLEAFGLYAIFATLTESEIGSFGSAAFIAIALLCLDLVLAIVHHRFASGINQTLEIKAILESRKGGSSGNIESQKATDRLNQRRRTAFAIAFAITIVAVIKFGLVYFLNPSNMESNGGILIFLAIAYSVTATIHIRTSGYLLHALWAAYLHHRDVKKFKESSGQMNQAVSHEIDLGSSYSYSPSVTVIPHTIDSSAKRLICKGILFDAEIEKFVNEIRDGNSATELVCRAMELQTRMAAH